MSVQSWAWPLQRGFGGSYLEGQLCRAHSCCAVGAVLQSVQAERAADPQLCQEEGRYQRYITCISFVCNKPGNISFSIQLTLSRGCAGVSPRMLKQSQEYIPKLAGIPIAATIGLCSLATMETSCS